MNPVEAVELLKGRLEKVPSNAQFLMSMNLGLAIAIPYCVN